ERTEAILHGLVEAFTFFGGVPHEGWGDNPTTVVARIFAGRQRRPAGLRVGDAVASKRRGIASPYTDGGAAASSVARYESRLQAALEGRLKGRSECPECTVSCTESA